MVIHCLGSCAGGMGVDVLIWHTRHADGKSRGSLSSTGTHTQGQGARQYHEGVCHDDMRNLGPAPASPSYEWSLARWVVIHCAVAFELPLGVYPIIAKLKAG